MERSEAEKIGKVRRPLFADAVAWMATTLVEIIPGDPQYAGLGPLEVHALEWVITGHDGAERCGGIRADAQEEIAPLMWHSGAPFAMIVWRDPIGIRAVLLTPGSPNSGDTSMSAVVAEMRRVEPVNGPAVRPVESGADRPPVLSWWPEDRSDGAGTTTPAREAVRYSQKMRDALSDHGGKRFSPMISAIGSADRMRSLIGANIGRTLVLSNGTMILSSALPGTERAAKRMFRMLAAISDWLVVALDGPRIESASHAALMASVVAAGGDVPDGERMVWLYRCRSEMALALPDRIWRFDGSRWVRSRGEGVALVRIPAQAQPPAEA